MAEIGTVGPTLFTNVAHELRPSATVGKLLCVRISDGAVLSLQPDGTQQYRPKETGGFERCELSKDGRELVYHYWWAPEGQPTREHIHHVTWRKDIPSAS